MPIAFLEAGMTSWQVPAGVASVKVECIGAGGNGNNTGSRGGGGGGGGAYARRDALAVTPGGTIQCQIGAGGSQADTWFGSAAMVLAKAGTNATLASGGLDGVGGIGGSVADSVGDAKFAGGDGGDNGLVTYGSGNRGAGGGGGAAGPRGRGGAGGVGGFSSTSTNGTGGGGGGANGGGNAPNGAQGAAAAGAGGTGPTGAAGGSLGAAGTAGSGGSGALCGSSPHNAGAGSHNGEWAANYGVGAGGGGGGRGTNSRPGGAGAGFGGGGGGGGNTAALPGGTGGGGLIVITYTIGATAKVLAAGTGSFQAAGAPIAFGRGYGLLAGAATVAFTGRALGFALMRRIGSRVVTFLEPGTTSWRCPDGVTAVRIECIGAGSSTISNYRTGGGGGAYSRRDAQAVVPGQIYPVVVPGASNAADEDGYSDTGVLSPDRSTILCSAASAPPAYFGGAGGKAARCIGDVCFDGGDGRRDDGNGVNRLFGGGGGGAGGPRGPGGHGGLPVAGQTIGAGGGGANGGADGADAGTSLGTSGNGGRGPTGVAAPISGSATLHGTYGAGGTGSNSAAPAGNGSHNAEWDSDHGLGSGGGACLNTAGYAGGSAAVPGAYGGGAGATRTASMVRGGPGLIVISYDTERHFAASSGDFVLTGRPAGLQRTISIAAAPIAVSIAGGAASIAREMRLAAAAGLYRADIVAAALVHDRSLFAGAGDFALAGVTPSWRIIRRVTLAAGSAQFTIVPAPAALRIQRRLQADAGAFAVGLSAVSLRFDRAAVEVVPTYVVRMPALRRVVSLPAIARIVTLRKGSSMLNWPRLRPGAVMHLGADWSPQLAAGDKIVKRAFECIGGNVTAEERGFKDSIHTLAITAVRPGVGSVVMIAITEDGETLKEAVQITVD